MPAPVAYAVDADVTLRLGDACACATARAAGQGRLLSFDRALSRVPGVERTEAVAAG